MKWPTRLDRRWFALLAVFSLLSLVAIPTGDWNWLWCLWYLAFLTFLLPQRAGRASA